METQNTQSEQGERIGTAAASDPLGLDILVDAAWQKYSWDAKNVPYAPSGASYVINTLEDIFNLPNARQIEVCLADVGACLLTNRLLKDAAADMANRMEADKSLASSVEPEHLELSVTTLRGIGNMPWSGSLTWVDDGKSEGRIIARLPDETEIKLVSTDYTTDNIMGTVTNMTEMPEFKEQG